MTAKEIQKRNAKAESLRVLQADDGSFYVESEKGKILYNVILDDEKSSCTCGDFAKNSKKDPNFQCKQMLAVLNAIPKQEIENARYCEKHVPRLDDRFMTNIKGKDFVLYVGVLDLASRPSARMDMHPVRVVRENIVHQAVKGASPNSQINNVIQNSTLMEVSMKITTLEKVFNRVDALSQNCFDQNVNVKDLTFENLNSVNIAGEYHPLKTIAQRSITWRLGIPFQYLRKCPPEIQSVNLNYWIEHEKNDQLFFRMDGQEVRAIFTPRYKPVDSFEILERLDSMGYGPDTQVQCSLDSEFMSLSILDGKKAFDINGDKFKPGISISNSEVGLASLSIAAFILRLVCTNGMVSKTAISASYRHVSTKILDEFPVTMDKVSYELGAQKHKIGLSMESPVDEPLKTIESFNRQFNLNQSQREAVVEWAWPQEMGDNMFAVVNKGWQKKRPTTTYGGSP